MAAPRPLSLAVSVALAFAVPACGGGGETAARDAEPKPVVAGGDDAFDRVVRSTNGPVLALFTAPWSGPDQLVVPYLDTVARERPALRVVKVDVDRAPEAAGRHKVLSIPTAMVLIRGRERGKPVVGALPRDRWERQLGLDAVAPRR